MWICNTNRWCAGYAPGRLTVPIIRGIPVAVSTTEYAIGTLSAAAFAALGLGRTFQHVRLLGERSVLDNVALPLRIAGVLEDEVREAVTEMLAWVGLAHRADALPATLSGGEQQRVAIARAVIGRPEILIADEPTGNVDEAMADRLMQLFGSLNGLGTTVILATHDLQLLGRIRAAQLLRIDDGRLSDPTGALRYPPRKPA